MDYINRTKYGIRNTESGNGFTLLELVISIAVLSIISVILATIIIRSGFFFEKQTGLAEVGLSNRFVLDEIATQVRAAKQVEENFTGNGQNFTTGAVILVLKLPSVDAAGSTISGVFDRVVFYLDGGKINKKVFPDATSTRVKTSQILTTATKTLNFSYNNANVASSSAVTVNLTTVKNLPAGNQENTDKIEVVLRNY